MEKQEREKRKRPQVSSGDTASGGSFRAGLTICLITGPMGTVFIYGIGSSTGLVHASAAAGANPMFVGCVPMALTFSVGFMPMRSIASIN